MKLLVALALAVWIAAAAAAQDAPTQEPAPGLAPAPAPTPTPTPAPIPTRLLDTRDGRAVDVEAVADDLACRDVLFFGEMHDSAEAHALELELLKALHSRRPDLVISMEMFERDGQGALADYLSGRIDQATFLAHSRPWPNYAMDYAGIIEYAKEHHLDVLAANIPRKLASGAAVAKESGRSPSPLTARVTLAPVDGYRRRFFDVMKGMKGHGDTLSEESLQKMYQSQCFKDDTMAESIVDYLEAHSYRRPLVLHYCGSFHCDFGLGTAARVVARRPTVVLGIVSTVPAKDVAALDGKAEQGRAHFVLVTQEKPEEPEEAETTEKPGEKAKSDAPTNQDAAKPATEAKPKS